MCTEHIDSAFHWNGLGRLRLMASLQVQRDFEELPAAAAEALRRSLLKLVIRFAHGPLPVRTQLCLAIAAMAAHVPSQQWGQGGIVQWLADNVGSQSQDIALPCMLELLTVLPEVHCVHRAYLHTYLIACPARSAVTCAMTHAMTHCPYT